MSRGSVIAYPINDPRYGMTPSEVEAHNRSKEFQEGTEERRDEDVKSEIERDIAVRISRRTNDG